MLVLGRKKHESFQLLFNDLVLAEISVSSIGKANVHLGIEADRAVRIIRTELKKDKENEGVSA